MLATLGALALAFVIPPVMGALIAVTLRGARRAFKPEDPDPPPFFVDLLRGMMIAVALSAGLAMMFALGGGPDAVRKAFNLAPAASAGPQPGSVDAPAAPR